MNANGIQLGDENFSIEIKKFTMQLKQTPQIVDHVDECLITIASDVCHHFEHFTQREKHIKC